MRSERAQPRGRWSDPRGHPLRRRYAGRSLRRVPPPRDEPHRRADQEEEERRARDPPETRRRGEEVEILEVDLHLGGPRGGDLEPMLPDDAKDGVLEPFWIGIERSVSNRARVGDPPRGRRDPRRDRLADHEIVGGATARCSVHRNLRSGWSRTTAQGRKSARRLGGSIVRSTDFFRWSIVLPNSRLLGCARMMG